MKMRRTIGAGLISILLGSDEHALELAQETEDEFSEELIKE